MILRKIERWFSWLRDSELEISPAKSLRAVARVIELLRQSRVNVRDVELLQIVVAVERPVGVDQIILRRGGSRANWSSGMKETRSRTGAIHSSNGISGASPLKSSGPNRSSCELRKIVLLRRETHRRIELGHRHELPVERVSAAVVAAAK